mgnify:FL=1
MNRQTYSDNVDSNGVAYKTVGDNIRDGSKSAESVVKALQSDDITFDMQAIMNVLPFMDSTKKIIKETLTLKNGVITNEIGFTSNSKRTWKSDKKCYGIIVGEFNGIHDFWLSTNKNGNLGITLNSDMNEGEYIVIYLGVNK